MPVEETTMIETVHGHKVVFKSFITGFDLREIEGAMYANVSLKVEGKNPEIDGFDVRALRAAEDKSFELVILSINGQEGDIIKRLLELPAPDFIQIKDKVNEITGKKA